MNFIKELLQVMEAEVADAEDDEQPKSKPTKTKQKSPKVDDLNLNGPSDENLPAAAPKDAKPASKTAPSQRVASKADTLRKSSSVPLDDDAMRHLHNLHQNMPDDEEQHDVDMGAEPTEPPPPQDLPALIPHQMAAAGYLEPEFHLVANLPGNMSSAIRRLGKSLFAQFTTTPTDQITMIASLGGMGPNTPREINAVAAYCKTHGDDLGPGNIDFDQIMPGYAADVHNYEAGGVHFMLVKDFMGQYIYTWPAASSKLPTKQQKKLK